MSLPLIPTLEELLHPSSQPEDIRQKALNSEDPLDPIHLFNMTWRQPEGHIEHRVLPKELTGVDAPIVVMCAYKFPTGSHKVGPAFSCVREKLLSGEVTLDGSTLVFPSTGNFGIGGAWVGPRLGFRSLVVLPEEMSAERFEKIRSYGAEIIATPGCESNVKEIYDCVNELQKQPQNKIMNQFALFGNYRFHYQVTGGSAVELVKELAEQGVGNGSVGAFVSAMGSSGTIAAGDHLKKAHPGCKIVSVEPVQCPTLFNVGYGGHAIEGIGDKHVTWIHNVRNTDLLVCIEDQHCLEGLQLMQEGRDLLAEQLGIDPATISNWDGVFGISGVCNILASIKAAKYYELNADQPVLTVATDGFDRYPSVMKRLTESVGPVSKDNVAERLAHFRHFDRSWIQEGAMETRRRWHNQKYFTWVEQQGKSVEELNALWSPSFWEEQVDLIPSLDEATIKSREK